ncbi:hypothetical protein U9M48_036637 [Paspalum notatum var. saurae]|uniref:Uncharacterized protein n=1 Tax=Paspalum notatum var. saurae TaxID=547442 RepID=A0AAQ3X968_PASNO
MGKLSTYELLLSRSTDHGIEEPTQDLPLIEKPDDKWNPKQEDDVSLSWPSLCISDYDQG